MRAQPSWATSAASVTRSGPRSQRRQRRPHFTARASSSQQVISQSAPRAGAASSWAAGAPRRALRRGIIAFSNSEHPPVTRSHHSLVSTGTRWATANGHFNFGLHLVAHRQLRLTTCSENYAVTTARQISRLKLQFTARRRRSISLSENSNSKPGFRFDTFHSARTPATPTRLIPQPETRPSS